MKYLTKKCASLSDDEIAQCSRLFSNHYGYYSPKAPRRAGESIRLGVKYYQGLRGAADTYVSLAYAGDELVGQAFYVLEKRPQGYLSWVIQLVVNEEFRRRAIAKTLLLSVWGFSNDQAWGLATTNPLTIKTLESATCRKVAFGVMKKNLNLIYAIGRKVQFIQPEDIEISDHNATVDSRFHVDHGSIPEKIKAYGDDWPYGPLDEGKEWLAFVFQEQEIVRPEPEKLDQLLADSQRFLVDAYSRMQVQEHPWAQGASNEADFIQSRLPGQEKSLIDFGCGTGRHLFELRKRGYQALFGIDFSATHIQYCKEKAPEWMDAFEVGDCREFSSQRKFDYALCLYDVIGSFPNEQDNVRIVKRLYDSLKPGGIAIVSVMNMELTRAVAKKTVDIYAQPEALFKLKASRIMQSTGDIFDPDYFIIDSRSGTVVRKEKFTNDGGLSVEYIVRDRRYTRAEIEAMATGVGFSVVETRFVRAGKWQTPLASAEGKEILLVLRKPLSQDSVKISRSRIV